LQATGNETEKNKSTYAEEQAKPEARDRLLGLDFAMTPETKNLARKPPQRYERTEI
jgi:hypothetical protein